MSLVDLMAHAEGEVNDRSCEHDDDDDEQQGDVKEFPEVHRVMFS